ncbi:MAG: hypothetical protein EP333_07105 [Bacteroidetes bacterium]|nr:MAG: hypothetical protein EP333_07105 [Bacteroidota bacterium]
MKYYLFLTTVLFASIVVAQPKEPITGFWHDMPIVGSGYGEHYQFFEDGTFVHGHNQMDCADSVIQESGTYHIKGKKLVLNYTKRLVLAGGKLVPATGSCGSDFEIEGAMEQTEDYRLKEINKLSPMIQDEEYEYLMVMKIGKYRYYRMSKNPKMY